MEVSLSCKAIRDEDLPCSDPALFVCDHTTVLISWFGVKLQAGSAGRQFPDEDFHLLLKYSLLLQSSLSFVKT